MKEERDNNVELEELFSYDGFSPEQERMVLLSARRKSRLRIGVISFGIGILLVVLLALLKIQVTPYIMSRQIVKVSSQYDVQGANLHLSDWNQSYRLNSSFAEAVRYKMVEGIPVYEGTVRIPGNQGYPMVRADVSEDWIENQYEDTYTAYGSKVMLFLWPQGEYERSIMDFDKIEKLRDGEAAELGISFDKAYSYEEITAMLPEHIDLAWVWVDLLDGNADGAMVDGRGLVEEEADIYGFSADESKLDYAMEYFEELTGKAVSRDGKHLAGMVVTGTKEELMELQDQPYVKAASMGAVVSIY